MTVYEDWSRSKRIDTTSVALPEADWSHAPLRGAERVSSTVSKRLFDIVLAIVLLIPLSFIMVLVAVIILIAQGRPIFYSAERMRAPGLSFQQLKFRTMLQQENDSGATGAHKHWRITPIGRFLRRTRADELPQLFNILRGDMSFVGPRPPLREYVEKFPEVYAQVLKNRPGATGLATLIYHQHEDRILARCKTAQETERAYYQRCLPAKLRIDEIYAQRRTMRLDLWILWSTIKIVLLHNFAPLRSFTPVRNRR